MLLFPWGVRQQASSDKLDQAVARALLQVGTTRNRLTSRVYIPVESSQTLALLEAALHARQAIKPIEAKIRNAEKTGQLDGNPDANVRDIAQAVYDMGGITDAEYQQVRQYNELISQVIAVDDFPFDLKPDTP